MIEELLGKRGFNLLLRSTGQYMGITRKQFRLKQIRTIPLVNAVKRKQCVFLKITRFLNILSVPEAVLGIIIFILQIKKKNSPEI